MNMKLVTNEEELKKPCESISSVEEAKELAEELMAAVILLDGVGLSANQIGVNKKMSIIKDPRKGYIYLINPELVSSENEFIFESEGCLSFPNRFWKTKRYSGYMIKNQVIDGDKFREETQYYYCDPENVKTNQMSASDLQGICCQHEMDHIIGNKIITEYGISQVSGQIINKEEKVGRNDPCPCGKTDEQGKVKKYKKCCGKL